MWNKINHGGDPTKNVDKKYAIFIGRYQPYHFGHIELIKKGNYNIRFLGDDYKNKKYTGDDLDIKIHFLNRDHGWSTTKFKTLISKSI